MKPLKALLFDLRGLAFFSASTLTIALTSSWGFAPHRTLHAKA